MSNIFSSADILLPKNLRGEAGTAYSVIACDQFTSEPEFWKQARKVAGNAPSALNMILPEAYLDKKDQLIPQINKTMESYETNILENHPDSMIYLRRTQPDGRIRKGIIGKIDLEYYDYESGSQSLIRPTEMTVIERIPPRARIRENASLEIPHIMLLIDDPSMSVIEPLDDKYSSMKEAYNFDLMLGAGHVCGYYLEKNDIRRINTLLARYATSHYAESKYAARDIKPLLFAVGDGNHSLATAKAVYEKAKEIYGKEAESGPERYALVEIVNLHDPALDFEPIYRIVKCDSDENAKILSDFVKESLTACNGDNPPYDITVLYKGISEQITVSHPTKTLPVALLQELLDKFTSEHPSCETDYIHGENSLIKLSKEKNTVGFMFRGMNKSELFKSIILDGILPRKTFSMGHALDKRHYLEARKIK